MPDTAPITEHIKVLLARVPADEGLWRNIADRHFARVFIGWFMTADNEEAGLGPEILSELGRRSLRLDFDLYCFAETGPTDLPAAGGH